MRTAWLERVWTGLLWGLMTLFVVNIGLMIASVATNSFARRWLGTWLPEGYTTNWYTAAWREFQLGDVLWVTIEVVVPAALGGIVTGALLAMARAAGETAPLLFTALGNEFTQVNPLQPMGALALTVFKNALVPYTDLQDQAWAAALLLVLMVAVTNILARIYLRRIQR